MAERTKRVQKASHKKNDALSYEANISKYSYLNFSSPKSKSDTVIKTHKPALSTPKSNSYSISTGRQKNNKMELLRAIASPVRAHTSRMKQNSTTESSCSPSPVRGRAESLCANRETNNSSRTVQPVKKFMPTSDNVIFFKEIWNKVVNRYPEWVQRIWRTKQKERMAEFFQEANKRQTGDKSLNYSRNAEESIKDIENVLTPISEEHQNSSFSSLHSVSATEATGIMDLRSEDSPVSRFRSRSSLERNSLEFSKGCDQVEWREWSLQLTSDGKLIITGKLDQNTLSKSRDVSSWERVDAHTLRHRKDGTTYKLVGAADHFVCQDLPSYVRTKFQYGFPEKWLDIKNMWMKYRKEGNPPNFVWSPDTDYNRVKPRLNRTFAGSSTTDRIQIDHIPIDVSNRAESLDGKLQPLKHYVSEEQGKTELSKRETMKDVSNIAYKRPVPKAHSRSMVSTSDINKATTQQRLTPIKESSKENSKKLKASKNTKNEPQVLKNWYPLLSNKKLKFSGILESGQNNLKHTTSAVVTADIRTQIVSCTSGERYMLVGDLDTNACTAPEFIKKKFSIGVPFRWKVAVRDWIEAEHLQHSQDSQDEQKSAESDEDKDVEEVALEFLAATGNLKKSRRGRVIVPPLQYWLGERVTVYGDNSVYCPSPCVGAKLPSNEQLDLNSPNAKKKKYETPIASSQEVKKTGIKTRLF